MVRLPSCACPHATELFNLLGKKWIMFIMRAVDDGSHTFTDIRKNIGEANTKILTDRLTELVDIGILDKTESGEYTLTKLGGDLSEKLVDLANWWGKKSEKGKTKIEK